MSHIKNDYKVDFSHTHVLGGGKNRNISETGFLMSYCRDYTYLDIMVLMHCKKNYFVSA